MLYFYVGDEDAKKDQKAKKKDKKKDDDQSSEKDGEICCLPICETDQPFA